MTRAEQARIDYWLGACGVALGVGVQAGSARSGKGSMRSGLEPLAVLPVRHVVRAVRIHAGTLSDPMSRHRWRIRVIDRSRRIADSLVSALSAWTNVPPVSDAMTIPYR
jgi:hypothetical protein